MKSVVSNPPSQQPAQRARLEDVARLAGVSKSIVSRYLNGYIGLSLRPETRERIAAAVGELNYRPHAVARALKREQNGLAALLVPDLTNAAYARMVRGAMRRAAEIDVFLLVLEDAGNSATEDTLAGLLSAGRIDGLIVASAHDNHPLLERFCESPIPLVFANRSIPGSDRNVALMTGRASSAAVDYLADLGHRHIAHIAGPPGISSSRERSEAFEARSRDRGLESPQVIASHFSEGGGASALPRLLADDPSVTAIFTSSLPQGIGVLYAIWERGLRVPDDLSVIAYDDLPLADFTIPPLTTVRVPLEDVGIRAIDALADQMRGVPRADVLIDADPTIVERRSVAAPRQVVT